MTKTPLLFHRLMFGAVLMLAYSLRVLRLGNPEIYYFDEVYHAFTARYYALNLPQAYEWWHTAPEGTAFEWLHPPVAKLFQGFSIYLLGDFSFAWRLPSLLAGVLVVAAVYWLAQTLFKDRNISLLAALFASFEGLLIAQSRIAMNDIFVTLFILLGFSAYWKSISTKKLKIRSKYYYYALVWAGLAVATKWSGVFVLLLFWLFEAGTNLKATPKLKTKLITLSGWLFLPLIGLALIYSQTETFLVNPQWWLWPSLAAISLGIMVIFKLYLTKDKFKRIILLLLVPVLIYLISFGQFWLQNRPNNLETFIELHHQIIWYQTHLSATHPWQSQPYQWVLNLKPVWYYVNYDQDKVAHIFALGNPAIAWLGLVTLAGLCVYSFKHRSKNIGYLLSIYLIVWLPWQFSPRIMFYYHYTPAMALLCISLAVAALKLWRQPNYLAKVIGLLLMVTPIAIGLYFYPIWTGLHIPNHWMKYYYWLPSWKP